MNKIEQMIKSRKLHYNYQASIGENYLYTNYYFDYFLCIDITNENLNKLFLNDCPREALFRFIYA